MCFVFIFVFTSQYVYLWLNGFASSITSTDSGASRNFILIKWLGRYIQIDPLISWLCWLLKKVLLQTFQLFNLQYFPGQYIQFFGFLFPYLLVSTAHISAQHHLHNPEKSNGSKKSLKKQIFPKISFSEVQKFFLCLSAFLKVAMNV